MKDNPRQWHQTHVSNKAAGPMFGKLSGTTIIVFLLTIGVSMVGFIVATQFLGAAVLPSLFVALFLSVMVLGLLLRFFTGKPKNYAQRLSENEQLKKSNSPLLSKLSKNENQQSSL